MSESGVARYRYRAYPNAGQQAYLARVFGCVRVVFNDHLFRNGTNVFGPKPKYRSAFTLMTSLVTAAKKTEEREWLAEVPDTALRQSVMDAHSGYQAFFDSCSGKRQGSRVGVPQYKRKTDAQSFRLSRQDFEIRKISGSHAVVRLPKALGWVRFALSRELPAEPSSVTVIKEPDGRYYVSFVVTRPTEKFPASDRVASVDLGLTSLAAVVYSDGSREKIAAPKFTRKYAAKLASAQRELARRVKGSKNREKSRVKVAAVHRKIRETRLDHNHKLAHRLVSNNHTVVFETLGITGLARTKMAKSVHDAAWGQLIRLAKEKAAHHHRTVTQIGRFEPTSQVCAVCGHRDGPKPLNVREWECTSCHSWLDRDYNAAVNIMVAGGHSETLNAGGEGVRLALAGAVLDEAGTNNWYGRP
jgi:putative transposase